MIDNKCKVSIVVSSSALLIFLYKYIEWRKINMSTKLIPGRLEAGSTTSRKECTEDITPNRTIEFGKANENAHEPNRMTKIEKEEFIKRMKGMSREELELVVEIVPIDLCLRRINKEIDRLRTFEDSVKSAVSGLSQ